MPVKIRLMRIGAKKRPFYRVVAVDERAKRTGGYIELLGTYNPLTNPKEIILKQDRIDVWTKNGAVMSDGFLRIIGKAPQRLPRKPKKEKKEEPAAAPAPTPTEQAPTEEATENVETSEVVTDAPVVETEQPVAETETPAEETPAPESTESTEATKTPEEEAK